MPTPQQYATQSNAVRPINGVVPGLTWAQFVQNFGTPTGNQNGTTGLGVGADVSGLGSVTATRAVNAQNSWGGGEGGSAGGSTSYINPYYDQFSQDVGDGTRNTFYQTPDGGVTSHNDTINADSWWDSTGLPLVASLAFGGATAGLSAAGIGVDAAGNAIGAGTAGLAGGTGSELAQGGAGLGGGVVPSEYGIGLGEGLPGQVATGAAASTPAATPGLFDGLSNTFANLGTEWGQLNPLLRTGITTLGGQAAGSLFGGGETDVADSSNPYSGFTNAVTNGGGPSGTGQSFSDSGYSASNNIPYSGNANDSFTPNLSTGGGNNGSSGLLGSLANLYNNGLTGGSASDYTNLLGGAGSILSGILGYNTAQNGINAQTNAANQNNALQAAIYANQTALAKPFVDGGTSAFQQQSSLNGLNGTAAQTAAMGQFQQDPGRQYAIDQSNRALQASASAAGGLYSGRAAKDLQANNVNQANQSYNTYYNRLGSQAGIGQAAVAGQAANGNAYANGVSNNNNAIGNAQTAGGTAGTNAITGSINGLLGQNSNNALLNLLLKNQGSGSNGYYGTTGG